MCALTYWLNIKRLGLLLLIPLGVSSQSLTIEKVNTLARENYPLIKQKDLIRQTAGLSISNIGRGYLPQLSLNGQATYQSDVTKVDVPIPGIEIEAPGKDQYKLAAEVSQLLYDGGLTKQQKALQELNAAVEDQEIELELYRLQERINQVYLGILYLDEQMKQVELVKVDLQTGARKVAAQVQNGVAFRSALSTLKAELIKTDQRLIELKSSRRGLIETLGLFINQPLGENVELEEPVPPAILEKTISRPEIKLFTGKAALLNHQQKLITARNLPKTSLFLQGGYGRPGLNLLKNEFDFFYVGGVRLNWQLGGIYTSKNERQIVRLNQKKISIQREAFLLNTNIELNKQHTEVDKLNQLIAADNQIIELRKTITESAKAQLENGVITASDYLREVNAEDQARQSLITHKLLLLQAQINYQTISGK